MYRAGLAKQRISLALISLPVAFTSDLLRIEWRQRELLLGVLTESHLNVRIAVREVHEAITRVLQPFVIKPLVQSYRKGLRGLKFAH